MNQPPNLGLWAGMENANVYENGVYLTPGIYDLEIIRCIDKMTREKGPAFIAEAEVLSSTNPEHPVGSKRTWYQKMVDLNVGQGAIGGFLFGIFDLDNVPARKTDFWPYMGRFMPRVVGPENVLSGLMVHVRCTQITTVKKGQPFTKHDWEAFDYAGMGLPAPSWDEVRDSPPQFVAPAPGLYPVPTFTLPPGGQMNPERTLYWAPGMPGWAPVPR